MTENSIPLKQCKTCHQFKPQTKEYFRLNKKWWENECLECANERYKVARRTPKTKPQNRVDKDGYKVCGTCGKRKPYTLEFFNPRENGRLQSNCKECRNKHGCEYHKEHPEIAQASSANARARVRSADGTLTSADILQIYKSQRGKCWWCSSDLEGKSYQIDHRIPLSRGGSNDASNLCISCPRCNIEKRNKLPSEWTDRLL